MTVDSILAIFQVEIARSQVPADIGGIKTARTIKSLIFMSRIGEGMTHAYALGLYFL